MNSITASHRKFDDCCKSKIRRYAGFLPEILFRGDKIYCLANFYYFANFAIVLDQICFFGGDRSLSGEGQRPLGGGGGLPTCGRKPVW